MGISILFKKDKEKIMKKLEYYGIKELPYLLTMAGKEKVRAYSGSLTNNEIMDLDKEIGIELIGLYLLHEYHDNLRLSFDAISALREYITENILELNDKQADEFLKGRDIALSNEEKEKFKTETKGFKIMKHKGALIGSGKLTEDRIINYMPKERRLR